MSRLLYREENWPLGLRHWGRDDDDDYDIYVLLPYELGPLDSYVRIISNYAIFVVLAAVLIRVQIFWDATMCCRASWFPTFKEDSYPSKTSVTTHDTTLFHVLKVIQ
jgi:hypothetical protein